MKIENIIIELKDIRKNEDMLKLNNLIEKLEKQLRLEVAYKSNSKTKINTIVRLCKSSEKIRPNLSGYHINDIGQYEITDSYRAYSLNPLDLPVLRVGEQTEEEKNQGIKVINGTYPNLKNIMVDYNEEENVIFDINDIMFTYKTRDKKDKTDKTVYELKSKSYNTFVDVVYLKETFDILGTDIKISLNGNLKPISVINNNGEFGIIMPIAKY